MSAGDDQQAGREGTEDALLRRVEFLEERMRALAPSAPAPPDRRTERTAERRVADLVDSHLRLSLPAYLSLTLTQAEEAILLRDVALQVGDEDAVRGHEERAAGLACVALSRVADEFAMPDVPMRHDINDPFLRGAILELPPSDGPAGAPVPSVGMFRFRDMEAHILRIAGLGEELAVKHLDGAFAAYRDDDQSERLDSADDVRRALLRAADAACTVQGSLVRERRGAASRHRRRRNIRRCLLGLGGATIAVANTVALPLIGPFAVAASAALGGGAAGAVANLIEG